MQQPYILKSAIAILLALTLMLNPITGIAATSAPDADPTAVATPATTAPEDGEAYATPAGTNPDEPEPEEIDPVESDQGVLEAAPPDNDDGIVHENTPEEMGLLEWDDPARIGKQGKSIPGTTALQMMPIGTLINIPYVVSGVTYANPAVIVERNHSPYGAGTILKFQKSQAQVYFWGGTMSWKGGSYANSNYRAYMQNYILPKIKDDIRNKIITLTLPTVHYFEFRSTLSNAHQPTKVETASVSDKLWVPTLNELDNIPNANNILPYGNLTTNGSPWANALRDNTKADGSTSEGYYATRNFYTTFDSRINADGDRTGALFVPAIGSSAVRVHKSAGLTRSENNSGYTAVTLADFLTNVEPYFMLPNDIAVSNTKNGNGTHDLIFNIAPTTPTGMTAPGSVNAWDTGTVTWDWNPSTDANGDTITYPVEISVNGGAWTQVQNTTARSYTRTINIPGDTYYQLRVRAYDGKEYSAYLTSGMVTVNHDTTAPTIQVIATPDTSSGWIRGEISITVMMADSGSGLKSLTVPAGATPAGVAELSGATATRTFTTLANGTYNFTVSDNAGLTASASAVVPKVDNEAPVIAYGMSPASGDFTNGDVTITLTLSDTLSGLSSYFSLDGTEDVSGDTEIKEYVAKSNGIVPFSVTDMVGLTTIQNVLVNQIDRVNPQTSISPRVKQWTNAASVPLDIAATDDYSGIDRIIMPNATEYPENFVEYEITENGEYLSFSLDRAGNISSTAVIDYQWFDRTAPTVRSVAFAPTDNIIVKWFSDLLGYNRNVRIEATGDDTPEGNEGESGIVTMHYRVLDGDGGVVRDWAQAAYGSKPEIDYDINGSVEIYFKDAGGNASDAESYDILVDLTPPTIAYTLSTEEDTYDPVTVTLTVADEPNGSGPKGFVLPDGNIFAGLTQITYTFNENGIKYFTGYDRAGNPKEIAVEVSNIVPQPLEGDWGDNQVVIDAVLHATGKRTIADVTKADMQRIIFLDLSSNSLHSLPGILANAENLERLDLRGNEFTSIPDCVFEFSRLRYLDVSNNNLTEISGEISRLTHLETLDASLNYLLDYDCPAIISKYRDMGNFTSIGRAGQYSFSMLSPERLKEYAGNTAQISVEWIYDGEILTEGLEQHRKALFTSLYPAYRTYRPLLFSYKATNGNIKTCTPDYVQVFLPDSGVASVGMALGM